MAQVDFSDRSIKENYARVRAGKLAWLMLGYGEMRNSIVTEDFSSSLEDLPEALRGSVQFVYLQAPNSTENFILAVYISQEASALLKAKSGVHKRHVAELLPFHHLLFISSSPNDFRVDALLERIASSGLQPPASDDLTPQDLEAAASGPVPPRPSPIQAQPQAQAQPVHHAAQTVHAPVETHKEPEPPKPIEQPKPVVQKSEPPKQPSAPRPRTDVDDLLEGLTEEEVAKLLEESGLDKANTKVIQAEKLNPAAIVVYDDDALQEKRKKEAAELEALIQKIESNSNEVPAILNLNGNESITEDALARLGKALPNNTVIVELLLANCNINGAGAASLLEGLKENKSVTHLNLESNSIGGPGLEAIASALTQNSTLKELRITNQRTVISGKPEREFIKALEINTSLQKLGYTAKDQTTRNQVDKFIFRNRDLARQARNAEKKK